MPLFIFEHKKSLVGKELSSKTLKVHCRASQGFDVDFFEVENGGEETRGRGADQQVAGLGRFFFSPFRSSAIDRGRTSCPCKVIPLSL